MTTTIETFYNKNHDPKTGRFTSGPGGAGSGDTEASWGRLHRGNLTEADRQQIIGDMQKITTEAAAKHGLTVETGALYRDNSGSEALVLVDFTLKDKNGRQVGSVVRSIKKYPNEVSVSNDGFRIAREWQDKGIGGEITRGLEDYYKAHGVNKIEVHANVDVGGYAWAKAGFQYQYPHDAGRHLDRVLNSLPVEGSPYPELANFMQKGDKAFPTQVGMDKGFELVRKAVADLRSIHPDLVDTVDYEILRLVDNAEYRETSGGGSAWFMPGTDQIWTPSDMMHAAREIQYVSRSVSDQVLTGGSTPSWNAYRELKARYDAGEELLPYEIAMIGFQPDATTWPGKDAMMNTDWHGVKFLQEPSTVTASLNEFYSPSQPRDGRGRWTRRGGSGSPETLPGMEHLTPYRAEEWERAWAEGSDGNPSAREIEEHHDRLIDNFGSAYRDHRGKPLPVGLEKPTLQDDPAVDGFGWSNYTDEWAEPMNAHLRGVDGEFEVESYSDWDAAFLTDYMDRDMERWSMPFSEEAFVFRGIRNSPDILPETWRPGTVIEDPGFLSTSGDRAVANRFKREGGWALVYRVPGGTRFLPGVDHESEAIFPRGSRSRVVKVDHENRRVYLDYVGSALTASIEAFYSASQPRDGYGRWTKGFGGAAPEPTAEDLNVDELVLKRFGTMKPEDTATAVTNANPMKGAYNCQMCVAAYEMRRRGIDAVAREGIGGPDRGSDYWGSWFDFPLAGEGASTNLSADLGNEAMTSGEFNEVTQGRLITTLSEMPNDSRGFMSLTWLGGRGSGHVMAWEKTADGTVQLVDPQDGTIEILPKELPTARTGLWAKEPLIRHVARVDNVRANSKLLTALTTSEQISQAAEAKAVWRKLQDSYSVKAWPLIERRTEIRRQLQSNSFPDADAYLAAAKVELDLTAQIDQLAEPVRLASNELRAKEANLYKNKIALDRAKQRAMNPLG